MWWLVFALCDVTIATGPQPAPFASSYGASKALLSHFGNSLAIEAQQYGIDVTIFHPSYTHSNLYRETPKLDVVTFLSKFGWTPDQVAKRMFACAGRVIVHDIGFYAIITNLLGRFWDSGFLTTCIIPFRDSMAPKKTNNSPNKKTQWFWWRSTSLWQIVNLSLV